MNSVERQNIERIKYFERRLSCPSAICQKVDSLLNSPGMSNEIAFKLDPDLQVTTKADFTYKITPNAISITDTNLGKLSVANDIDTVLRKIEHWHQGSIDAFKIIYRDEHGVWNGVRWNGQRASFFALAETDARKAMAKLLREKPE
jgi:hypothetical protein